MNNTIINLSNSQMALSYLFVLIAMLITSLHGINRNKDIIISVARMTIQLLLAGLILVYIFDSKSIIFASLMIIFMEGSAVYNIVRPKIKIMPKSLIKIIALAMGLGSLSSLIFFLLVVVRPNPIYNPQYLIPLGGMIMGNSMNGISLALNSLLNAIRDHRSKIEGSLMLGASPKMAMREINRDAFDTALLPCLNNMKNMGLITLPGMMTGQILSGVKPIIAIKYQIAIMTAINAAVTIGVFIFIHFAYTCFFNKDSQLISKAQ